LRSRWSRPQAAGGRTGRWVRQGGLAAVLAATIAVHDGARVAEAQTSPAKPFVSVAAIVLIEPAAETPFPIQIGPADAIPPQTFLRIRGLPRAATLSEGHSISQGSWAIPLASLSRLKIAAPLGSDGRTEVTISLVAVDGTVLSETKATMLIAAAAAINAGQAQEQRSAPQGNTASLGRAAPLPAPVPQPQPQAQPAPQAKAAPPIPMAPLPELKPEDRERAMKHMQKGDEAMVAGNVTIARLFYTRAAEIGLAQGALALAGTYDANELARWKVIGGINPDKDLARKWYERARELGATEAADRLARLR
jgi:hypothetical protein